MRVTNSLEETAAFSMMDPPHPPPSIKATNSKCYITLPFKSLGGSEPSLGDGCLENMDNKDYVRQLIKFPPSKVR